MSKDAVPSNPLVQELQDFADKWAGGDADPEMKVQRMAREAAQVVEAAEALADAMRRYTSWRPELRALEKALGIKYEAAPADETTATPCPKCGGKGRILILDLPPGPDGPQYTGCSDCKGTGVLK